MGQSGRQMLAVTSDRTGDRRWTLGGNDRWELAQVLGRWRVAATRMLWTWEEGDPGVLR